MTITSEDLYKSILYRAADIYEVDYDDVERDIGEKFDPVIRFMSGALASELELVYQHIDDTESRLQKRLAKVLLPEYFHLPSPAHALAKAVPASESIHIKETTTFETVVEEGEKALAFTPVFPGRLLSATIEVIATESTILDPKSRPVLRRRKKAEKESARRIIVGVAAKEPITEWNEASLFFDLRGRSDDVSERTLFFSAIPNSQCRFGGHLLDTENGLLQNDSIIEDYLNGNERLQSTIRARYERQFITFGDTDNNKDVSPAEPRLAEEVLRRWFSTSITDSEEIDKQMAKLNKDLDKPLYWLEIELARPLEIEQLSSRLVVDFNVFPVVNRRLNGHLRGEHHYLQKSAIRWVSLEPEDDFMSIRKVYEEKPPDYTTFIFKPFADFKEERKPSYTLRHGGVGRWDNFNAWQRLAYVIRILQDNYEANDLVQKAASSLSLEDVHNLLGKKISRTAKEQKPVQDIYVLLHSGIKTNVRVRVEYWTSQGESGNEVAAKTALICTSVEKSSLDKESIELVTESIGGRDPLNATQQLSAMKSALLSRGRIVTREDVKIFCKEFLQDKLEQVIVQDGVGTDPRFDFGMTRLLDIILIPTPKSKRQDDWEGLCHQAQILLEQKSTSSIPIRVQVGEKMKTA